MPAPSPVLRRLRQRFQPVDATADLRRQLAAAEAAAEAARAGLARAQAEGAARTAALEAALATAAKALLQASGNERRLDSILNTVVDGILHLRTDGTIEQANAAAARVLQVPAEALPGSKLFAHLACKDDADAVATLEAALLSRQPLPPALLERDYAPRGAAARAKWLRLAFSRSGPLLGGGYLCVISDLTERHKVIEERLILKKHRMTAAVENNQISTWELDLASGELTIHEALARELGDPGLAQQPASLDTLRGLLHPDDRPRLTDKFAALQSGSVPTMATTCRLRRCDGSHVWVRLSATTITRQDDGTPLLVFGTTIDISELVGAREAAERNLRSKEAFVACMTHELRTPLNSILGFAELLASEPKLDDGQRDNVDYILQATQHLITLTNQTLDLARLESGHLVAQNVPFDLGRTCSDCVQMILPAAAARQIRVDKRCATMLSAVGDVQRVKQILLNLLSNAVKYNRLGGQIVVASGGDGDGLVWVTVRDTGRGVREEDLDALFEPFVRLDTDGLGDQVEPTEGSGIGLAISRDLARLMDGRLEVASEPGAGSTFRLTLPAGPGLPAPR